MSGYFWCRKTKWVDNKPVVVWRGWVKEGEAKTRALTELGFKTVRRTLGSVTELSLDELAISLRDIEGSMGRSREGDRSGPRTIDLDVLVWNGTLVDEDVYSRAFLGDAVRELCPDLGEPTDEESPRDSE